MVEKLSPLECRIYFSSIACFCQSTVGGIKSHSVTAPTLSKENCTVRVTMKVLSVNVFNLNKDKIFSSGEGLTYIAG